MVEWSRPAAAAGRLAGRGGLGVGMTATRSRAALTILLMTAIGSPLQAQDRLTGRSFSTRSEIIARHGMVATSQPLPTAISPASA